MKKTRQIIHLERTIKDYGFKMISLKDGNEVKDYTFIQEKKKVKKTITETFDFVIAALKKMKEDFPEVKKFDTDYQLTEMIKKEFLEMGEFEILKFDASITVSGDLFFPIEVKIGPNLTNEEKKDLILSEAYHKAQEVFQQYFNLEDTEGFQFQVDDFHQIQDWNDEETNITISDKDTSDVVYKEDYSEGR